jgi:hypothetical protein
MILQTRDKVSFAAKTAADRANQKIQDWEASMCKYQSAPKQARPDVKRGRRTESVNWTLRGMALLLVAGALKGSFTVPMKFARKWENR